MIRRSHNSNDIVLDSNQGSDVDAGFHSRMTYWDEAATTRWGSYISEVERRVILQGQSEAGRPSQALEIGCGSGRWAKMLSDFGWQMTCVDANSQALEICQQKVPTAKCILAHPDDETIPCESESVSLLLCIEVGEVLETQWFLPEAHRVLKRGGVFVGVCWNRHSWRGMACRLKYRFSRSPDGHFFYRQSYSSWKSNLLNFGFDLLYEEGLCWGPFQRTSNSALVPNFVALERILGLNHLTGLSPWIVFIARKVKNLED